MWNINHADDQLFYFFLRRCTGSTDDPQPDTGSFEITISHQLPAVNYLVDIVCSKARVSRRCHRNNGRDGREKPVFAMTVLCLDYLQNENTEQAHCIFIKIDIQ